VGQYTHLHWDPAAVDALRTCDTENGGAAVDVATTGRETLP